MFYKTPPTSEVIDSFFDDDENEYGLVEHKNKYGKGETRYYLQYNGEVGDMPYSRAGFKRLKDSLTL